jgi:MFS family permease
VQVQERDRRARFGAAGAFFVQGLCFATLVTHVPALKEKFGFSDLQLTLILAAVPVVAGLGSLLAGALAPRLGSGPVLRVAAPLVCVAMALVGLAGSRAALYPAVAGFGLVLGAVDATMNMQGVAVQQRYGRSLLASFHGWWSVAGILGSLSTAGFTKIGLSLAVALGGVGLIGAVISLSVGPLLLKPAGPVAPAGLGAATERVAPAGLGAATEPAAEATRQAAAQIPWRPIVLIGLAVMVMYIADSATSNWSALYLHDALHGSKSVAALGVSGYLTFQVLGRSVADRVVQRLGPVRTVASGGLIGVAGLVLVAAAPTPWAGIVGFAILGVGLCVVVPQSFSAAGALDPTGSGVAIARVNLFNYAGFVTGAALIGLVSGATSLRGAFALLAALGLAVVGLARAFRVAGQASDATGTTAPAASPV